MMKFLVKIYLNLFAKKVGKDEYGNQYFELKRKDYLGRKKRFCLYKGFVEASKISPEWHLFMHYQTEPSQIPKTYKKYKWQRPSMQVLTLSKFKFLPKNHPLFDEKLNIQSTKTSESPFKLKVWKPN